MAAINFPAASESPWYNSETGVTYVYENGAWRAASSAADSFDTTYVKKSGDNMTGSLTLGGTQITLNSANGSSTFAGNVTCGSGSGVAVDGKGAGVFYRATSSATDNVFVAQSDVGSTQSTAAFITAAGSADFNGRLNVGDPTTNTGGLLTLNQSNASSGAIFLRGVVAGDTANPTVMLRTDGSADFAGTLSANGGKVVTYTYNSGLYLDVRQLGYVGVNVITNGEGKENACIRLSNGTPGSAFLIAGYGQNNNEVYSVTSQGSVGTRNVLFQLEPDNDANYTTTTDSEGNETRVYNGPTLDVKERLTKADTALQTLKSAAAAAVDFAELKAAIATALADI